jgi:hypothetical protein
VCPVPRPAPRPAPRGITRRHVKECGCCNRQARAGAWLLDAPAYYRGRFMTVSNNVHAFVAAMRAGAHAAGGHLSLLHAQLLAAAYQHAVLRDAYALAHTLRRTLVLPPLWAWCDWDPSSDVLLACVSVDNEGSVPYQGPSDLYVNIEVRLHACSAACALHSAACGGRHMVLRWGASGIGTLRHCGSARMHMRRCMHAAPRWTRRCTLWHCAQQWRCRCAVLGACADARWQYRLRHRAAAGSSCLHRMHALGCRPRAAQPSMSAPSCWNHACRCTAMFGRPSVSPAP